MASKFIKRLTDNQIKEFLEQYYSEEQLSYKVMKSEESMLPDRIFAFVNKSHSHSEFYDFSASGFYPSKNWIKYLYRVFGEEYKQAYLAYYARMLY